MTTRTQIKRQGRASLKRHYLLFVGVCLIAAFLSSEFRGALSFSNAQVYASPASEEAATAESAGTKTQLRAASFTDLLQVILEEDIQKGQQLTEEAENSILSAAEKDQILGRSRGVLANLVNQITSGSILVTLVMAATSITGSESLGILLLVIIGTAAMFSFWFFVQDLFPVVVRRIFLEGMIYQRVTPQRFVFLLRIKRWLKAAWIMFVKYLLYTLWSLTLVGMVVKRYSYYLVPYIVAENPDMTARQAITLSRKMMQGHKWECFLFELSFLGWHLLGIITFGLVDLFYTNPYKIASFSEYYARLRAEAIAQKLPGSELLWDVYLYQKADSEEIAARYADVIEVMNAPDHADESLPGWRGFLANHFGILFWPREQERLFEEHSADLVQVKSLMDDVRGEAYPARLYPIPEEERRKLVQQINYNAALLPLVAGRNLPVGCGVRLAVGGGAPSGHQRRVGQPRVAPRPVAPHLRRRLGADAHPALPPAQQAGAGVRRDHRAVRVPRIYGLRHHGISERRRALVGLQRLFPEPQRADLRGGAAALRRRRDVHRVCRRPDSG